MAELKTKLNDASVEEFINNISDSQTKEDCFKILKLMKEITKEPAKMWGASIVGFGNYHYVSKSKQEGDWFLCGFSPRKQNITLYLMYGFDNQSEKLKKLGKFKTGRSCLYVKKLDDINIDVLKDLISDSYKFMKENF